MAIIILMIKQTQHKPFALPTKQLSSKKNKIRLHLLSQTKLYFFANFLFPYFETDGMIRVCGGDN